jgi:stage V sporulation protein AC
VRGSAEQSRAYQRLVDRETPRPPVWRNVALAFVVGGSLCALAQIPMDYFLRIGMRPERAGAAAAVAMVVLGAVLTGLGLYDEIANAVVAPALEYRWVGWVLGVGARIFSIAGPVIVYGMLAAVAAGTAYWALGLPLPRGG